MMKRLILTTATIVFALFCLFTPPTLGANNEGAGKEITSIAPVIADQSERLSSRYENPPAESEGLYYATGNEGAFYASALVISYKDKPVPPPENDPDAPTKPGLHLKDGKLYAFQKIEVIGKKVYFKTRSAGGASYE